MSPIHRRWGCVALALMIGGCGQATGTGQPSTAAPSVGGLAPSVALSPAVRPLRETGGTATLDPGTYVLDDFPVDLAFDVPDRDPPGWVVGRSTTHEAIVLWNTSPKITYGLEFFLADNVYNDPCDAAAGEREPPIGPSIDDLVAAISSLPEFHASAPVDVRVGAFEGLEIELAALDLAERCPEAIAFSVGEGYFGFPTGAGRLAAALQILDADGTRVVVYAPRPDRPEAAVEAKLQKILDSVRIEPLP